jgi:hypothetical protein
MVYLLAGKLEPQAARTNSLLPAQISEQPEFGAARGSQIHSLELVTRLVPELHLVGSKAWCDAKRQHSDDKGFHASCAALATPSPNGSR